MKRSFRGPIARLFALLLVTQPLLGPVVLAADVTVEGKVEVIGKDPSKVQAIRITPVQGGGAPVEAPVNPETGVYKATLPAEGPYKLTVIPKKGRVRGQVDHTLLASNGVNRVDFSVSKPPTWKAWKVVAIGVGAVVVGYLIGHEVGEDDASPY